MLLRSSIAALGGLALAAAFEPIGHAWLMPLALAVLMITVRGLTALRGTLVTFVFGVAFMFSVMVWMRAVGTDAWLAMCTVMALFFLPLGLGLMLALRLRAWPVWAAVWWVAIETWRGGWPFSGMPFGRLAYATADTIWAPALPWVGMTGVSLLVALSGTALAWVVVEGAQRPRRALVGVAALVVVTVVPVFVPYEFVEDGSVTVAAIQGDVPGTGTDVVAVHREVTDNLLDVTRGLAERVQSGDEPAPDLVVWPENSTAVDPFTDTRANAVVEEAASTVGAPLLLGAMVDATDETKVLNQGIVWRHGVGAGDRYTKRHPVPYGEYIPFRGSLIPSSYGKLQMIPRDMVRGARAEPLRIAGVRVADAICFDVAYDDGIAEQLRHGGQLIAVQTSNAMFVNTGQIQQQFEISRLRAIEGGRWVVVAAINGVSGIVSPDGDVVRSAERRSQAALVAQVGLSSDVTWASRAGVWPGRLIIALALLHAAFVLLGSRRLRDRGTIAQRVQTEGA